LLVACCIAFFNTSVVYAAPTVTESKDNITVTKQAEWTEVDGKHTDNEGNPYAKISFKVNTTGASDKIVNVTTKAGDADIIIVLDNSGSMGTEFDAAKDAAADFAAKMIDIGTYNVRVGLVTMGSTGIRAVELTSDKNKITSAIKNLQFDPVMWGTNFQEALYETQNMLSTSTAPNKLVVFQSDGVPEQCYKTFNCTNKTGTDIAVGANDSECALNQTAVLKRMYPDVKLATIGYTHATSNHTVLKQMASTDASGNMMFFESTARAEVTAYLGSLADAFKDTGDTFSNIIVGNTLVDEVPSEYEILGSSFKTNDSKVVAKIDSAKNLVTFKWDQKLEKKVYELSFVIKLKKSKVPSNYITEKKEVYTNGKTIDVTKDSSNSAVFTYGSDGKIALKSPTLQLDESRFKVEVSAPSEPQNQDGAPQEDTTVGQQTDEGISQGDATVDEGDATTTDETPSTGDSFDMSVLYIMIGSGMILAIACAVIIRKKRSKAGCTFRN
jgi:hypothetical protein